MKITDILLVIFAIYMAIAAYGSARSAIDAQPGQWCRGADGASQVDKQ